MKKETRRGGDYKKFIVAFKMKIIDEIWNGHWERDFVCTSSEDTALLMGVDFNIDNQTIEIIDGEIRVLEGCTATISNSDVFVGNGTDIIIESGANLIFENCDVVFDNNMSFIHEGLGRGSMIFVNTTNSLSFTNKVFSNINLYVEGASVTLANNDKNQAVSSGIYFYTIKTNNLIITKKMVYKIKALSQVEWVKDKFKYPHACKTFNLKYTKFL